MEIQSNNNTCTLAWLDVMLRLYKHVLFVIATCT